MIRSIFIAISLLWCLTAQQAANAQCPEVLSSGGEITANPIWYNCTDGLDILAIETASSWNNLIIDWGDGNPLQPVGALNAGDPAITHSYDAGDPSYVVTLSEADGSCEIQGYYYASPLVSDFWGTAFVVCQGNAVQFHQETAGPGIQYQWNFGMNPSFLNTATGNVSFTFQNPGTYLVQSVVQLTGAEDACSDTSSMTVYVLPSPDVELVLSDTEGCGSAEIGAEAISPNAFMYVWSFGIAPYFESGSTLDPIAFDEPGSYPISLEVTGSNGCHSSLQEVVIVYPEPVADFDVESICIGEPTLFNDASTIETGTNIVGWFWQFGDGNVSYTQHPSNEYAFTGDYEVSLTVTTPECSSTTFENVSIHPVPTVVASSDFMSGCAPLEVSLEASGNLASTYSWNLGNGNVISGNEVSQILNANFGADLTHEIIVTATSSFGCVSSDTISIEALQPAEASFSMDANAGCAPFQPVISNESTGAVSYAWNVDGSLVSNENEVLFTFENTSNFMQSSSLELVAIASNGCHDSTEMVIESFPQPDFSFTLPSDSVCSPLELTMPAIFSASTYAWDFGNGEFSNEPQPNVVFENTTSELIASTITFSGISAFGCEDEQSQTVYIKPQPIAAIAFASAPAGCAPFNAAFDNNSTNGDTYIWNFGDGSEEIALDGAITHDFNAVDATANYNVTLTAIDALGCSDTATESVTIFPAADFNLALTVDSVCSPLVITMPEIAGAQDVTWNFGDGTSSNELAPSHTWENLSNELMSAIVSFEGQTADGCLGTASATVHIKPQPTADIALASAQTGCAPFNVAFDNNSTNGDTYIWNFGDGSEEIALDGAVSHDFSAVDATANYNVILTAIDALGCSDTATESVTIFPAADFNLALTVDSVCSPLVITMPEIAGAQDVTWNFGDGTASNELAPSHTWENLSNELMSAIVSFEGQTADGCLGTASATVHIKPQPVAAFEMTVDQGCEPLNTTLINMSENADLFVWSFGNGQAPMSFPTTDDVAMTFDANGEPTAYEITLIAIDALGCTDEQIATVEVLPTPSYVIQLEESESCSPYMAVMPAMEDAMTSFWIFGDGTMSNEVTPAHSWTNNTNDLANHIIEFQGSNAYGCFSTTSTSIAVKPQPVADFSTNLDEGCAPLAVVLSNESVRADTFDWNYGDGNANAFANTNDHDYTFEGQNVLNTYSISLTATHNLGCSDVKMDSVSVFPAAFAAWTGSVEGCAPFETTLEYVGNNIDFIQWDMGNGENINAPVAATTYNGLSGNDATYMVSLAVMSAYGCSDMTSVEVLVHPAPLTGLTVSENNSCAETEVLVFNASTFADSVILHLGNGDVLINSALTPIAVEFENETSGDISFLISQEVYTDFGCSAFDSIQHTVHPKVTAAFQEPQAACTPSLVGFENQSIHATDGFAWSFGDGTFSNEFAPEHVFDSGSTSDQIYTVSLIAMSTAGCTDTTSTQVTVFGTPEAQLSLDSLSGCYPVEVTYANQSEGHTQTSWSYGNGETGSVSDSLHSKVFFNPTSDLLTYTTTMTVLNEHGCSAEAFVSFDVAPHLNAAFDVVSQGCSPVDAQLINQSIGAASFVWNFNDGSLLTNEVNPDHIFVNNTNDDMTFEVQLIALSAYGCLDTLTIGVDVYPMPSAEFSVTPLTQTFPNTTVGINNMSVASESAIQYWSFGDGAEIATDQPVFHTYNTWGTYNITLLVDNGYCADAHTQEIQILSPNPVADFTGGGAGCAPLLVVFENESNHGAGYVWDFGDDYMTSEESPVHVYTRPGVYNVSLTVIGHEGQEHETVHYATVEVFPTAEAAFVFSPSQVVAPDEPVEFVNLSPQGATEFLWTFGDGMVSTEENPIYTYAEPGVYDVSLTANNTFNCPSTFTMEQAVEAIAGGFMKFPTGFTPNNGGSTGGGYDPGSYDNDVFHPYHLGIIEYELVVFNKWGELIFRSTDANIGWDGYFQGRIARQDVYAWRATAQFSNGHRITKAGDITLIIQ